MSFENLIPGLQVVWIQSSSFSETSCYKVKEPTLPYYLPIARKRIVRFSKLLALCERPTASFRIWTRIAKSTSSGDNRYTLSASCKLVRVSVWTGKYFLQVLFYVRIQKSLIFFYIFSWVTPGTIASLQDIFEKVNQHIYIVFMQSCTYKATRENTIIFQMLEKFKMFYY